MHIISPNEPNIQEKDVPWWIILISVIAGLGLMAGVVFVLYKVSVMYIFADYSKIACDPYKEDLGHKNFRKISSIPFFEGYPIESLRLQDLLSRRFFRFFLPSIAGALHRSLWPYLNIIY